MSKLQKPVEVLPLIKFFRWSLLIGGIFYGANKLTLYRAIEKKSKILREIEIEQRRLMRKERGETEVTDFVREFSPLIGVEVPPDWRFKI